MGGFAGARPGQRDRDERVAFRGAGAKGGGRISSICFLRLYARKRRHLSRPKTRSVGVKPRRVVTRAGLVGDVVRGRIEVEVPVTCRVGVRHDFDRRCEHAERGRLRDCLVRAVQLQVAIVSARALFVGAYGIGGLCDCWH